jgi:hypothetical protein
MKTQFSLAALLICLLFFNYPQTAYSELKQQYPGTKAARSLTEPTALFPAEIPKFSVERGFYKKPFDVVISTGVDEMTIYYTLDGSDPATSPYAGVVKSPAKVTIDPQSIRGRGKTPGVVLRARAKSDKYNFSPIATRTYLFIDKINCQTTYPGYPWPEFNINGQYIDLSINQIVLEDTLYSDLIGNALLEVPSISLTTDNSNLFDPDSGIYVNAWNARGAEWERPASVELINPDGSAGFQIDAGIRIRGGWSRNDYFRKHAFRLFFRDEYGAGKLDFPLFENEGVKSFDKIDLRCAQNYSWSKGGDESPYFTYTRDVFSRDIQGKMKQEYTRSRYYHLYLNGLYWGLYQTQERPEARFAASYMGGDSEDYDVVKREGSLSSIEATDGNLDAWRGVWNLCQEGFSSNTNYYKIQGLDANGVRDPNLKVMVDIDNLIDYMNIIFYTGNYDAPVSAFGQNKRPNNFYAIYNKDDDRGFTFVAHDNEHTLIVDPINSSKGITENRVNIGSLKNGMKMEVNDFEMFHPQWLHFKLSENAEYRQRFSDRSYKQFFNNGVFTPEVAAELFRKRTLEIDTAVIAESLRWGYDIYSGIVRTKDKDWKPAVNQILTKFFPFRTDIVIGQLQDEGLLSKINAPIFKFNGVEVADENIELTAGNTLFIFNPANSGNISYTIDGSDPRLVGDGISPSAINGGKTTSISVLQTCILKSRIFDNGIWSPLHTLKITVDSPLDGLQISEIQYNPLGQDGVSGNEFEFIELKNSGSTPINLGASNFIDGIKFRFSNESVLDPGKFVVLASNSFSFNIRYGFMPNGEYEGQLDNNGERISLVNSVGDTLISVKYGDNDPWPTSPDSLGFSLVPAVNGFLADWNDGKNWRASSKIGGSPNADDGYIEIPKVIINEILTNSDAPQSDAIELYNPNNTEVNISGWYLSDSRKTPKKWQIPSGTILPANGYIIFNEGHYIGDSLLFNSKEFGSAFSLNSLGDDVFLFSGSTSGYLTGYEYSYNFGAIEPGVSFGRYTNSTGKQHFVAQQSTSLNTVNALPRVGPVVINQIMYNPAPDQFEYLELINVSKENVNLYDETKGTPWKVSGIDFVFPKNITLAPNQIVYLVETEVNPSDFKSLYNLDTSVYVFNFVGGLKNEGEEITLFKSYQSYIENDSLIVPYIRIDKVDYNDNSNWPDADGNGYALQRIEPTAYGNDPASWTATPPGLRIKNTYLTDAIEGMYYSRELKALGGKAPYSWSTSGDGLPEGLTLNPVSGLIDGIPKQAGTFPIIFKVDDSGNVSNEVELLLTVVQNTIPIAVNDTTMFPKNHFGNINIINNDIDKDGDKTMWNVEIVSQPTHGVTTVNNDKSITIAPERDYLGRDSIIYKISDLNGSSEAKVLITVYDDLVTEFTYSRISSSSDDAEENINTKVVTLNSPILEMTYDAKAKANQLVGLRFTNIELPKDAVISYAQLLFFAAALDTSKASLNIQGEASANPSTFATNSLISSRPKTTGSVEWNPRPWSQEDLDNYNYQFTGNLASIMNEIIGMGWKSGGPFSFILSGQGNLSVYSNNFQGGAASPYLLIDYINPNAEISTPVAIINNISGIGKGEIVPLDGSNSSSSDTRELNYYWTLVSKPEGSNAQLSNSHSEKPFFEADQFGVYKISLKVDNGYKESTTVTISINVTNQQPTANAGSDQTKSQGSIIHLIGSGSTDSDGDNLAFNWQWVQKPAGSLAQLTSAMEANPKFTADLTGKYILSLTVSDKYSSASSDLVEVNVIANQPPLANAGNDLNVVTGSPVALNGTKSSDPEEDKLTYNWTLISKPAGSLVALSGNTISKSIIQPDVAGDYICQLTVSDGINTSAPDAVKVTAVNNLPPVANAGDDKTSMEYIVIKLDGSESFDPDAKPLIYQWSFVTKPSISNASLANANTAQPSFLPDTEGDYTIKLRVSDGTFTSEDIVQITASPNVGVVEHKVANTLSAYPNPFTDKLVVDFSTPARQKVEFSLYNITGALIRSFEFVSSGKSTQVLNLENEQLKSGLYLLIMKTENGEPHTIKVSHQ